MRDLMEDPLDEIREARGEQRRREVREEMRRRVTLRTCVSRVTMGNIEGDDTNERRP